MLLISKEYTFDSAHYLTKVPKGHPCSSLHGHTYTVIITIKGTINEVGFIMDYHAIDKIVKPLVAKLDHTCLNNLLENPTSENLVMYFYTSLSNILPIYSITVKETPKTSATWVNT
jgi:6-pyruvoyltetrahydropterin/6-carboxytetrahydropterin synthase